MIVINHMLYETVILGLIVRSTLMAFVCSLILFEKFRPVWSTWQGFDILLF